MNLYHLSFSGPQRYDVMQSCVVAAPNPTIARDYANAKHGDEGPVWLEEASCDYLGSAAPDLAAGLLCRDFNAG